MNSLCDDYYNFIHFIQVSLSGVIITVNFIIDVITLFLSHLIYTSPPSPLYSSPGSSSGTKSSTYFCLISAIDFNQFTFFMLANLLTGLVNFTVDTLHTSAGPALLILSLYMITLALVVVLLHSNSIKLV